MIENKLVLKNINHAYATKQSINNFCLTIDPGEIVCLLGPSGAGKTTLLKLIAGFESPSSGEILIGNRILFFFILKIDIPIKYLEGSNNE